MFDVGFSELVLVFIVGLVVLGPKRLPIAIRTVMGWVRTIRGLAHNVQTELAQELKLQELQESIKKAEALNVAALSPELSKTVEELKQSAEKMQTELANAKGEIQTLSEQQIADIQGKIEAESQALHAEQAVETAADEQPLSPAEIAEQAELDESQFSAYYPPDDDFATPADIKTEQEKSHVS